MATRLRITVPDDFVLARDACSYGYFLLHPNHWDPRSRTLSSILTLDSGPASIRLAQEADDGATPWRELRGSPLRACSTAAFAAERRTARAQITHAPPRRGTGHDRRVPQARSSLATISRGRLFRSPTMFEDVVKTVTSCNVQWPSTVAMNRRLCEVVGPAGAFRGPAGSPAPSHLRARCRTGYRATSASSCLPASSPPRLAAPEMDPAWFEDPSTPDHAVRERLLTLPGIGPTPRPTSCSSWAGTGTSSTPRASATDEPSWLSTAPTPR